jgi:hypothetical protein
MNFKNQELYTMHLASVRQVLYPRKNIFWIIGGSCTGKSTVCKALAGKYNLFLYDMDQYIFDKYQSRYTKELHPANTAWFTAENSMDWVLSFPTWEAENEFYEAANIEYFHLFAEDMKQQEGDRPILVDGGITNPAALAKVLPVQQILCLKISDRLSTEIWESETRSGMREMVFQLPNPDAKWRKFLQTNQLMNQQIAKECKESGIEIFFREENHSLDKVVNTTSDFFKFDH